eukprot:PhF_6_TR41329/c0_g1_i1/m.62653
MSVWSAEEKERLAAELERLELEQFQHNPSAPSSSGRNHNNNNNNQRTTGMKYYPSSQQSNNPNGLIKQYHHNNTHTQGGGHMHAASPQPPSPTPPASKTRTTSPKKMTTVVRTQSPPPKQQQYHHGGGAPSAPTTTLSNVYAKQSAWLHRKENNAQRMRREKEAQEIDQCTFRPRTNSAMVVPSAVSDAYHHQHQDVVSRLMISKEESDARLRKQRMDAERKTMQDCTFRPNIVDQQWTNFVSPRYLDNAMGKSPARLDTDCTFTPRINRTPNAARSRSVQQYLGDHVFDRLTSRKDLSRSPSSSTPSTNRYHKKVLTVEETQKFSQRMQEFSVRKQKKLLRTIEEEKMAAPFTPKVSKKSIEIAKTATPFSQRMQKKKHHEVPHNEDFHNETHEQRLLKECTFAPHINDYSSATMVPRSHTPDELCYHWNERREKKIAQARAEKSRREEEDLTFAPNTTHARTPRGSANSSIAHNVTATDGGGGRSMLLYPELYMQRLTAEQVRQERLRNEHQKSMVAKEMEQCTFRPAIHDAPKYVHTIAASMALAKKVRGDETTTPRHTFGYS